MKSYTDLKQSKKLAEILPLESADMFYIAGKGEPIFIGNKMVACGEDDYDALGEPDVLCWSLAALLGVLPEGTRLLKSANISSVADIKYHCDCPKCTIDKWYDNPVDACYEMVMRLNELKML